MYYNEELEREQSAAEVVCGAVLTVVVVVCVWNFLNWACE